MKYNDQEKRQTALTLSPRATDNKQLCFEQK